MFKAILRLVLLFQTSFAFSSVLPANPLCVGTYNNMRYSISKVGPYFEGTTCSKAVHEGNAYMAEGIVCESFYAFYMSFPYGDDWFCRRSNQYGQWTCSGVGQRNATIRLQLSCRN